VITPLVPETGWVTGCRVAEADEIDTVSPEATVLVLRREGYSGDPDPQAVSERMPGRSWTTERLVTGPAGQVVLVSRFPPVPPS
jgi:hypothetical protein